MTKQRLSFLNMVTEATVTFGHDGHIEINPTKQWSE
jgi:hypothetical protein